MALLDSVPDLVWAMGLLALAGVATVRITIWIFKKTGHEIPSRLMK